MNPFIVLIGGGTASGKTTIAEALAHRTGALHIAHDRYYRDVDPARLEAANFDHPDALDTHLLVEDLRSLRAGRAVALPVYEFPRHRRAAHTDRVDPHPLVIVEGILALTDPTLRAEAHLSVYIDTDDDLRLARRVARDTAERGWSVGEVLDRYLTTVRPMHKRYVAPSARYANLTLSGEAPVERSVSELMMHIRGVGGPA